MRILLVSTFLPDVTQHIHSLRASGLISSHTASTAGVLVSAFRKSDGNLCVVSFWGISVVYTHLAMATGFSTTVAGGFRSRRLDNEIPFEPCPRDKQLSRCSELRQKNPLKTKRVFLNSVVSSGGRSFSAYSRSTRFPFFQIRKSSKIWENGFESCTKVTQVTFSPEHSRIQKIRPRRTSCILSRAPAAGFEPATNALLLFHYF